VDDEIIRFSIRGYWASSQAPSTACAAEKFMVEAFPFKWKSTL
jgi:hypothetical protein